MTRLTCLCNQEHGGGIKEVVPDIVTLSPRTLSFHEKILPARMESPP